MGLLIAKLGLKNRRCFGVCRISSCLVVKSRSSSSLHPLTLTHTKKNTKTQETQKQQKYYKHTTLHKIHKNYFLKHAKNTHKQQFRGIVSCALRNVPRESPRFRTTVRSCRCRCMSPYRQQNDQIIAIIISKSITPSSYSCADP